VLRCIIVDDESGAVEILTRYVKRTPDFELVGSFRDSIEALSFLAGNEVDLVFLDIDMPNLDGMRFSELIRGKDTRVIFCTAYSEYAVESYEKEAIDYLLKPIDYKRFLRAANKALKTKPERFRTPGSGKDGDKGKRGKLFIKSGPRLHRLDIGELLYMEKKEHYVIFHTLRGQIISRMNMNDLMDTLPNDDFVRVHRSFVISVEKIEVVERNVVTIQGRKIPIGESYRENFFKLIPYSGS